jgi:hypothetical protein
LRSPDELKFCPGRHRPANTFPPVFTGLFIFVVVVTARMEKTRPVAMETSVQLNQLNQTLRQRTWDLAAASRQLKREWFGVRLRRYSCGLCSIQFHSFGK